MQVDELRSREASLLIKKRKLEEELKRTKNVLKENKAFKEFIESMMIIVKAPSDTIMPVNSDTIVGLNDLIEMIKVKKKMTQVIYKRVINELSEIEVSKTQNNKNLQIYK